MVIAGYSKMMVPHGNWRSIVLLFGLRQVVHAVPLNTSCVGALASTFQPSVALERDLDPFDLHVRLMPASSCRP